MKNELYLFLPYPLYLLLPILKHNFYTHIQMFFLYFKTDHRQPIKSCGLALKLQ